MNKGGCETGKKVKKTKGGCAIGRKSYGPKKKPTTRKPKTLIQKAKARGRAPMPPGSLIQKAKARGQAPMPPMKKTRKTRSDKGVKRGAKSATKTTESRPKAKKITIRPKRPTTRVLATKKVYPSRRSRYFPEYAPRKRRPLSPD
tara:strand:- start:1798 stop:2232 length:435 start_codon:yes stop_codon:yes gene_type:complete